MGNLDLNSIQGLPSNWQYLLNIVIFAGACIGGLYGYYKRVPRPFQVAQDATQVMIGGALADRHSMMLLAQAIESAIPAINRLADARELEIDERRRAIEIIERALKNVGEDIQRAADRATIRRRDGTE